MGHVDLWWFVCSVLLVDYVDFNSICRVSRASV